MSKIKSVLFVCTGNSCRSIMAEGLLKKYIKEEGKEHIKVSSAGVYAMNDMIPTPETIKVMKEAGVDVSTFRSKFLTDELIKGSDLILVMTSDHIDDIIKRVPEATKKVHLLKQYGLETDTGACEDLDILDPIGQPLSYYKRVRDVIGEEIKRIVSIL